MAFTISKLELPVRFLLSSLRSNLYDTAVFVCGLFFLQQHEFLHNLLPCCALSV